VCKDDAREREPADQVGEHRAAQAPRAIDGTSKGGAEQHRRDQVGEQHGRCTPGRAKAVIREYQQRDVARARAQGVLQVSGEEPPRPALATPHSPKLRTPVDHDWKLAAERLGAGKAVVKAGLVGAVVSGIPSTVVTLARRESLLDGARAAGAIVLRNETRTPVLLAAAVPVHLALSLGWTVAIARLPRRGPVPGVLAGLAIAALDLEVIGRRIPAIRALPQGRQWADHVAFGLSVGWMLRR
jgi:hypothetical protein